MPMVVSRSKQYVFYVSFVLLFPDNASDITFSHFFTYACIDAKHFLLLLQAVLSHDVYYYFSSSQCYREPQPGISASDQRDLLTEQLKMLAGEIALSKSTLKRLTEHSAEDTDAYKAQVRIATSDSVDFLFL